jgi:HYR domain
VVNELSHPGVTGDLMIGFAVQGARETQSISDLNMFAFAHNDAVNLPPTVNAGADIVSECNAIGGSNVTLNGNLSTDPENSPLTFSWTCGAVGLSNAATATPSGFFALDQTVTCRLDLTDTAACPADADTVDVTVEDTTDPGIACPSDITVECTATGGTPASNPTIAAFLGGATASDTCDALLPITNDAPALFGLGVTPVEFSTEDDSGNDASCSANVTVQDTTPPTINSVSASPNALWPPNHKMRDVALTVSVTDVCDAAASCQITSVTSNEPVNGRGDGNTAPDWIVTGPLTLQLRSERSGPGNGRIYTIEVTCTDGSGNSAKKTVNVTVAHDQS